MRSSATIRPLIMVGMLLWPVAGYAQEATVSGTVADSTGGVLLGVTVTAVHEATGNTFVAVTDERGGFRLPVRTGSHRITVELAGFTTLNRTLELLVGQTAVVNLQMSPSALQETVTVTGEAPLIDVTSSRVSGNIDPRQMQELPVNGRNWVDLSMLAPGNRANAVDETPVGRGFEGLQLNVDGQQITNNISVASFGQPRFSKDAIAEFEFVANRFDASQGRSSGVQVNAVTKSGTNEFAGSFSGYFRDDKFNAADHVAGRVLPYSNQQLSLTFGGPMRKDKLHFFGYFEYEREPQTFTYETPYPSFNLDQTGTRENKTGGLRLDFQLSSRIRLAVRANTHTNLLPFDPRFTGGATRTPSGTNGVNRFSNGLLATLTQVLGNQVLNEIRVGYSGFYWDEFSIIKNPSSFLPGQVTAPRILFRNLTIGQVHNNAPQYIGQDLYSARDDLTFSFNRGGRHDVKMGGEYQYNWRWLFVCNDCIGTIDAQGGPIPANIEPLFPDMYDVGTWNLAALSPITRFTTLGVQATPGQAIVQAPRHEYALWVQDDWRVTPRLTLNLGLRYDLFDGAYAEDVILPPFLSTERPNDTNNIGPRLGFAYSVNDRTVIRGGVGKYFAEVPAIDAYFPVAARDTISVRVSNDGRPDFAANPFNGPAPTFAQAERLLCNNNNFAPGCLRRSASRVNHPDVQNPYSYQASVGVQRQLASAMAVEADYVSTGGRHESRNHGNVNLSYDPATGVNRPFTAISQLPYPGWATVSMNITEARSNYHALQAALTKRMSNRWQASATYLLSALWDSDSPAYSGIERVPFEAVPDLRDDYSLAVTDQRHRFVFNGIWDAGYGFQLSGLYFFGSGQRFSTIFGGDLRQTAGGFARLRPDGTIVPRTNLVGEPLHRVDVRVQRRFRLRRMEIDGILEVFNLFNHANYGGYTTVEASPRYGQPTQVQNVAYLPRVLQLGFRTTF